MAAMTSSHGSVASSSSSLALPVALDAELSARLQDLLMAAAREGGPAALDAALDDGSVNTLVLALRLGAPPVATLVQAVRREDPVAQWLDLSCI